MADETKAVEAPAGAFVPKQAVPKKAATPKKGDDK